MQKMINYKIRFPKLIRFGASAGFIMSAIMMNISSYAQSSRPTPGSNLGAASGADTPTSFDTSALGDYVELDASMKNEMYGTIDFPNAELKDIIKAISKLAKKNFILDRKIENRRITILSPEAVTKQEAYNAFLSALYMNDLTIVAEGKFLKVIDTKAALQSNVRVFMGDYAPNTAEVITVLYPLKNLNADDIQRYLTDLVPRTGRIAAYPNTNTLVMTDTGFNLRRIIEIVKTIDVPGHEDQLENIPIRYANAKEIAKLIDEILEAQSGGSSRRSSARAKSEKKTRGGGVITKIVPDERTNSLVVLANGRGIEELQNLVDALDTPNAAGGGNIHLYYCKNAVAEELATTISSLISNSANNNKTTGAPGAPRTSILPRGTRRGTDNSSLSDSSGVSFDGNVRVTADKPTNSLVIVGSGSDFAALKKILEKLDIPRKQVYVEAKVLEMRIGTTNQLELGINIANPGVAQVGGFIPTGSKINLTKLATSPAATTGLLAGFQAGAFLKGANGAEIRTATGLIRALVDFGQAQILHEPQILTSDNEEAEVKVTQRISTITQSQTGSGDGAVTANTVEKNPVTISLKITPQLSENSDLIRMKVEQTLDDFSESILAGGQIDTTNRSTKTSVVVRDGSTVAIGGLQKNAVSDNRSRIPILGDLPVLGKLFGGTFSEKTRSTMMILLTPTIVDSNEDLLQITQAKFAERLEIGKMAKDPEDRLRHEVKKLKAAGKKELNERPKTSAYRRSNPSWDPSTIKALEDAAEEEDEAIKEESTSAYLSPDARGVKSNSNSNDSFEVAPPAYDSFAPIAEPGADAIDQGYEPPPALESGNSEFAPPSDGGGSF
ncbi:type II secretion system secretin GspD [bacterium]|nr:type II secretion system secretin GspD [bacterium]